VHECFEPTDGVINTMQVQYAVSRAGDSRIVRAQTPASKFAFMCKPLQQVQKLNTSARRQKTPSVHAHVHPHPHPHPHVDAYIQAHTHTPHTHTHMSVTAYPELHWRFRFFVGHVTVQP
jgi:hypothetical protein